MSPPATLKFEPICSRTAPCQAWLDVAEQEVGALFVSGRELGIEVGEDVEVGDQRFAIIHVRGVLACPEEALAGDSFEAFQIDAA